MLQLKATFLSTVLVNSSMTQLSLIDLAKSALNPSPILNTFLGLHQVGIEFKPTLFNLSTASSTFSKLLIIAFELSHSTLVSSPKYFENTLLPLPLPPHYAKNIEV